jgi:hypothetical protein
MAHLWEPIEHRAAANRCLAGHPGVKGKTTRPLDAEPDPALQKVGQTLTHRC